MLPELLRIGPYPLHTFGVMVAVGFIAGMWWCRREAIRQQLPVTQVMDLVFWLMAWGLVGARIAFILVNWDYYSRNPQVILKFWEGGLVWYGGFIAASLAAIVLIRRYRLPMARTLDICAPATMYGLAFGRLGCLAAGDDHGRLVTSALGPRATELLKSGQLFADNGTLTGAARKIIFSEGFDQPWWALVLGPRSLVQHDLIGLPLYPTQLIMSLYCLAIFVFLVAWRRRQAFPGQLVALMLLLYAACRYALEFLRGDLGRGFWAPGISTSQGVSFVIFAIGIWTWWWLSRHARQSEGSG